MFNWYIPFLAALLPLICGFIWYHPKIFGNIWIKASGVAGDKMAGKEMIRVFSLTYVLSLLAALAMVSVTIHQTHLYSMFADDMSAQDQNSETGALFQNLMNKFGGNFRTFKHGAFHGILMSIMLVLPVIGINAMFERKGFKYIAINTGYWMLSLALMGGVICAFF